jgi:hypothetical protein
MTGYFPETGGASARPTPMPISTPGPTSRFATDVDRLLVAADGRALPLARAVALLDDRGAPMAVFLLTLPFVMPLPTLGLALPVGAFLAAWGLRLAAGRPAVLPARLERLSVGYRCLERLARASGSVRRVAGRAFRPRLPWMVHGPMRIALGLSLAAAALVMALPLPLPASNFFPAVAILMLSLGLVEGDGLLVALGHVVTTAVAAGLYFASDAVWSAVRHAVLWLV